jgi:hypothetical protein
MVQLHQLLALQWPQVGDRRLAQIERQRLEVLQKFHVVDLRPAQAQRDDVPAFDVKLPVARVRRIVILDLRMQHFLRPIDLLGFYLGRSRWRRGGGWFFNRDGFRRGSRLGWLGLVTTLGQNQRQEKEVGLHAMGMPEFWV